jgi:2-keto-3-deoxy-galactonokinase
MVVTPITSIRSLTALPLPALSAKLFYSVCYLRDGPAAAAAAAPVGLERFPVELPSPTLGDNGSTSTAIATGGNTAVADGALGSATGAAVVPFMTWPARFVPVAAFATAPAGSEETATELPLHELPDSTSTIVAYMNAQDQVGVI